MRLRSAVVATVFAVTGAALVTACHGTSTFDCSNGSCGCVEGASCDFSCSSGPCHVDCLPGSNCTGVCNDGTCTCEVNASCEFTCASGPCHVDCVGNNSFCAGQCWDGQCTCGSGSSCNFACLSPPCHTTCAPGSSCVVDCPPGTAPSQCDIPSCGSGSVTTCPDGHHLTCNANCP